MSDSSNAGDNQTLVEISIPAVAGFVHATLLRLMPLSVMGFFGALVAPEHAPELLLAAVPMAMLWATSADYKGGLD